MPGSLLVATHLERGLSEAEVAYLPIPGIKPILGLLPLACGCAARQITVATTTKPGYPTPADWCDYHPHATHYALPLNTANGFRFGVDEIARPTDLIMMNYPHNPSGQVATRAWLEALCRYCAEHDVRLFNDAAYYVLSHVEESAALAEVAVDFPELSWAEAFTAAKLIGNGTGWHVGAMVGSADFIADMGEVKGKTDTGFVAPMAAGAIAAVETDSAGIEAYRETYRCRLEQLSQLLTDCGMRLALRPLAGFFTLWETPARAFGRPVESAEAFNFMMIDEVGVVGVPFADYVRYAVCANINEMQSDLMEAFRKANVEYR